VVPWWHTRTVVGAGAALCLGAVALGGWTLWQAPLWHRLPDAVHDTVLGVTADLGLVVRDIYVVGRNETSSEEVLEALGIRHGSPILACDLAAARERLLALPWVAAAAVERALPDTLVVRLTESRPLALWQHQGRHALIDDNGAVSRHADLQRFRELIVVVGEDAPAHVVSLMAMLRRQPELLSRVESAVWIGGRRWNLRLRGGIEIRLPEQDTEAAWDRLAEYQRQHGVLERDLRVLDLRFPDQVIVRPAARPGDANPAPGRDT
jgi:cell division protein FtsQ